MTINKALSLMKAVRERLNGLKLLRGQVAVREEYYEQQKTKDPLYDVVEVDRKIMKLERFLFDADAAIKAKNAITEIDLVVDVDELLGPLKAVE